MNARHCACQLVAAVVLALGVMDALAQTPMRGIPAGQSAVDPASVQRAGATGVTGWVWFAVGRPSEMYELGVRLLGMQYGADCETRTIRNLAMRAYAATGHEVPLEKQPTGIARRVARSSGDERVLDLLCAMRP